MEDLSTCFSIPHKGDWPEPVAPTVHFDQCVFFRHLTKLRCGAPDLPLPDFHKASFRLVIIDFLRPCLDISLRGWGDAGGIHEPCPLRDVSEVLPSSGVCAPGPGTGHKDIYQ